ncbi:hypothetical protein ACFQGE_05050 [Halomicroarcula sp. GCM10025817]|uniref:hypothetical protein n=1 Tax=Haloarcula TaxID=2237 RepID=UPI0023E85DCE|nr:hypothetical protein [Halomicroarcula sp. SYNS111]
MDAAGDTLIRIDAWLFHLLNVLVGIAVLVTTVLYTPLGTVSLDLFVAQIDLFYILVPLAVLYTCWSGAVLWRWVNGNDLL